MNAGKVVLFHLQDVGGQALTKEVEGHHPLCDDGVPAHHGPLCNTCHSYNTSFYHTPDPARAPPLPSLGAANKSPAGQSSDSTAVESSQDQAKGGRRHPERQEDQEGENQEVFLEEMKC